MLPSDKEFLELLKEQHGLELTEQDLNCIHEFQYFQELERKLKLAKTHSNDVNVQDLPVIGVVAGGVLGGFVGPLLGASWFTAALIGASIGWRLLGGGKKETPKQEEQQVKKRDVIVSNFGFNTAPSIVPLGSPIPIVYTNQERNVNGGVRTSGYILNSRVETVSSSQRLQVLYSLCIGSIGEIDTTKTLINNQTLDNFFNDEITQEFRTGLPDQTPISLFPFYSQVTNLTTNTYFGVSYKRRLTNTTAYTGFFIQIDTDNYGMFNTSDRLGIYNPYTQQLQPFKILSLNLGQDSQFNISNSIFVDAYDRVFGLHDAKFQTSKRCTEIHINFTFRVSARDENNENLMHQILFDLYVDTVFIATLYVQNNIDSEQKRSIKLKNLALQKHKVELRCKSHPTNNAIYSVDIYDVDYDTGVSVNGKNLIINTGGFPKTLNDVTVSAHHLYPDNKKYVSNEQSPPCKITTINEIIHPADLGHTVMSHYPFMVLAGLKIQASDRIESDPNPSFFIKRGRVCKNILLAGTAGNGSNGSSLFDLANNFITELPPNAPGNLRNGTIIRNLDKQIESVGFYVGVNTLEALVSLQFEENDRYVIYEYGNSNYFPDIFVDVLITNVGGLAGFLPGTLIQDFFIDYETIVKSRKYCVANNYYWDGAIDNTINFEEWVTRESMSSLLFPSRTGGRYGLIPEQSTNPVAIFSASNIIENSYSEENVQIDNLNCVHVAFTDGTDDLKPKIISVMTQEAYYGTVPLFPESLKFNSITNQAQAEKVGKVYLKSRLLQTKIVNFSTGLQGFGVKEGDLILIQYITTELLNEFSGFVVSVENSQVNYQDYFLSVPLPATLPASYPGVNTYKLSNGIIERSRTCQIVTSNNKRCLRIFNLNNALEKGDYIIVTDDVTSKKTFRVNKIEPQDDGSVNIQAVRWVPDILDGSDLFVID